MIECPPGVVEIQYPTLFDKPSATDNSGKTPDFTKTRPVVIGEMSESLVIAVTWTARDDSGNTDHCKINYKYKNEGKNKGLLFCLLCIIPAFNYPYHRVTASEQPVKAVISN